MISRMEMEEEIFLAEGNGSEHLGQAILSWGLDFVQDDGEKCINKDSQGYVRVLKVVKMV